PLGTLTSTQTLHDCKDQVCDGNGGTTTQNNDTDTPFDNETCTSDVCTNGVPSNPPVDVGTTCSESGGIECDGSGHCVECVMPSECPGTDTVCRFRTCAGGTCGFANATDGTACDANGGTCVAGECQPAFTVVRVGTGAAALTGSATDTF